MYVRMYVCMYTHTRARARTHTHTHTITYTCIQVVDAGTMILERNTIYDSCAGSIFHLGSTNSDDIVNPAVRQVVTGDILFLRIRTHTFFLNNTHTLTGCNGGARRRIRAENGAGFFSRPGG